METVEVACRSGSRGRAKTIANTAQAPAQLRRPGFRGQRSLVNQLFRAASVPSVASRLERRGRPVPARCPLSPCEAPLPTDADLGDGSIAERSGGEESR